MTDVRILGITGGAVNVESLLTDQRRWLLCSRDYLRGGRVLSAVTNGGGAIFETYPAAHMLDGNRQSFCLTTDGGYNVTVVVDTGSVARKALLFVEYFENEEVEFQEVAFGPDAEHLQDVTSDAVRLLSTSRWSLWKLPFDLSAESKSEAATSDIATYSTAFTCVGPFQPPNYWVGADAIPQTGPNAGLPRTILTYDGAGYVEVKAPWPHVQAAGEPILFRKLGAYGLNHPVVKLTLRNRWNPNVGPVRCVGVSLFDFFLELKGDLMQYRTLRAGNPVSRSTTVAQPAGAVHELLDGNVRLEQRGGPKRQFGIVLEPCPMDFPEWVEAWAAKGVVGLVDHTGHFFQGLIMGSAVDDLWKDNSYGDECRVRLDFREI